MENLNSAMLSYFLNFPSGSANLAKRVASSSGLNWSSSRAGIVK